VGLPESLRQMIEKQLERLMPAEQRVLEVASVVGSTFSAAPIASALETTVEEVEEVCAGLARRALLVREIAPTRSPDGIMAANYAFLHAFYQQVQYERLTTGRRIRLHRQLGQQLEAAYGGTGMRSRRSWRSTLSAEALMSRRCSICGRRLTMPVAGTRRTRLPPSDQSTGIVGILAGHD